MSTGSNRRNQMNKRNRRAMAKTEDRGQRIKDRGQRTEDRGQRTEDSGERTKDKRQRTTDKGQRTEYRGQKTGTGMADHTMSNRRQQKEQRS